MLRWSHFCSDRFRLPSNIFNWDTTSKRSAQVPKCPSYTYTDYVFKTSSRRLGKQEMFAGLSAWVSEYPSSALKVPKCPSAQVSKCSPSAQVPSNSLSAWLPSESPPFFLSWRMSCPIFCQKLSFYNWILFSFTWSIISR